ncbi:hypothetical protein AC629_02560 [Bradyrhizobium sp. NAS80.1]|nr:hypothetical protein AC629_02560 [Bradyrhizobium sp. NAS80.1]
MSQSATVGARAAVASVRGNGTKLRHGSQRCDPSTGFRGSSTTDPRAVAGDADAGDIALEPVIEFGMEARLVVIPAMETTGCHCRVDIRDDTLMHQQPLCFNLTATAVFTSVSNFPKSHCTGGLKLFDAPNNRHASNHFCQQRGTFAEIG